MSAVQLTFAVVLHVYRPDQHCGPLCGSYLGEVGPATMDTHGQALSRLDTAGLLPGLYYMVPQPAVDPQLLAGLNTMIIERPRTITPGQQAETDPVRDSHHRSSLWTTATGTTRVTERPSLYGGALVTVLEVQPGAVRVRTDDGVEGWIHESAATALTADLQQPGERAHFAPNDQVRVVWTNAIPLRAAPHADASPVREPLAPGVRATVQVLRGDWLQLRLSDGTSGWARWY